MMRISPADRNGGCCCTLRGAGRGALLVGNAQIWRYRGASMCTRAAGGQSRQSKQTRCGDARAATAA